MKVYDNDQNLILEPTRRERKYCMQVSALYQGRGDSLHEWGITEDSAHLEA